ncbi:copper amine oxidase N-terminal domain-containing protein [Paenibacillus sp. T3-5-0-4]|nr:copper amine oxidase N-terminal domain-containing protein [Paenibacillus endoradicis]
MSIKRVVQTIALLLVLIVGGGSVGPQISEAASKQTLTVERMDMHFIVDGKVYHTSKEQQAFVYKGRTYVPIRFASYLFELWVVWDQANSTVIIDQPTTSQLKQLQQFKNQYLTANADISKPASTSRLEKITLATIETKYKFFGVKQPAPSDAITMNYMGTVYVPIRYFTTQTNSTISYDGVTKSITMQLDKNQGGSNSGAGNGSTNPGTGNGSGAGTGSGSGEVDPSKPARASIVAATQTKLEELQTACSTKAYSLYNKFLSAPDSEKQNYISQGLAAVDDCDAKFEEAIGNMNSQLEKYDYEIGDEATKFKKQYDDTKAAMYSKFLG